MKTRKKLICDLHDAIIILCFKQEKLLAEDRTHTKNFKMNFKKINSIAKEAKKAGEAMEGRMIESKEMFKLYAEEMGYKVKRDKKKTTH